MIFRLRRWNKLLYITCIINTIECLLAWNFILITKSIWIIRGRVGLIHILVGIKNGILICLNYILICLSCILSRLHYILVDLICIINILVFILIGLSIKNWSFRWVYLLNWLRISYFLIVHDRGYLSIVRYWLWIWHRLINLLLIESRLICIMDIIRSFLSILSIVFGILYRWGILDDFFLLNYWIKHLIVLFS